jgi:ubiquinone/menaquinone biosynthesis C-methylase UbiE
VGRGYSRVWIFDVGAWAYDSFTANEIWQTSCASLLDAVPSNQARLQALDLGVGPGVSALAMGRGRPELSFIGLDLSQPMLKIARDNRKIAGWSPQRLSLLRGDALQLPFAEETMDVVTGHSFFYLLPDYHTALVEVNRVLRPGGYIAFLEPHTGPGDWNWLLRQGSLRLLIAVSLWRPGASRPQACTPPWRRQDLSISGRR